MCKLEMIYNVEIQTRKCFHGLHIPTIHPPYIDFRLNTTHIDSIFD